MFIFHLEFMLKDRYDGSFLTVSIAEWLDRLLRLTHKSIKQMLHVEVCFNFFL